MIGMKERAREAMVIFRLRNKRKECGRREEHLSERKTATRRDENRSRVLNRSSPTSMRESTGTKKDSHDGHVGPYHTVSNWISEGGDGEDIGEESIENATETK